MLTTLFDVSHLPEVVLRTALVYVLLYQPTWLL